MLSASCVLSLCFEYPSFGRILLFLSPRRHDIKVDHSLMWGGLDLDQCLELKEKLGQGAFSEVYRAVHPMVGAVLIQGIVRKG